jgi:hypothetical protein
MHDYCNVANSLSSLDAAQAEFCLRCATSAARVRGCATTTGRRIASTTFKPIDGRTLFTSLRHGPDGEQVFMLAHMEGKPTAELDPLALPLPGIEGDGWRIALRTPSIGTDYMGGPIILKAIDDDKLREECGVFGVSAWSDAANFVALGLHALQHRGQEAGGIVTHDPEQGFNSARRFGYVRDNFTSQSLMETLPGARHRPCALFHRRLQGRDPDPRRAALLRRVRHGRRGDRP